MNRRQLAMAVALVAVGAGLPIAGSAQIKSGATAADVALYTGADRMAKLIAEHCGAIAEAEPIKRILTEAGFGRLAIEPVERPTCRSL